MTWVNWFWTKKTGRVYTWWDEYKRKKEAPSPKTAGWYNKKSFSLIHQQQNGEELFSPELADRLVSGYKFLMPFYDYFITLDSDPDPGAQCSEIKAMQIYK